MNVLDMFYHLLSALVVVCCMLACATAGSGSGTGNSGSEMTSTSKGTELTLAVFLPLSSPDLDGRPYLPALELTLELINNNTDILPGYWVQATVNDSAVSLRLHECLFAYGSCHPGHQWYSIGYARMDRKIMAT